MIKKAFRRFVAMIITALMIISMIPAMVIPGFAANVSGIPVEAGITVTYDNGEWSATNGESLSVTGTAVGTGSCTGGNATTVNASVINTSGLPKKLVFDYTFVVDNSGSLTIDGVSKGVGIDKENDQLFSGTISKTLKADETVSIVMKSARGTDSVSNLTLNNLRLEDLPPVDVTFKAPSNGSYTVNGTAITSDSTITVKSYAVVATPAQNCQFIGWVNADNNELLSTSASCTLTFIDPASVKPIFSTDKHEAWFLAGGNRVYNDLNVAGSYAATVSTKTVVLMNNATLPADSYTIPAGVTLLIPFDNANTLITDDMGSHVGKAYPYPQQRSLYRQLTMPSGTSITVQNGGAISIGSLAYNQMKGQVGPYGAIEMDSGSNITIASGGTLYAWGYIFHGANGGGTVTVQSGGTVYESTFIMDYPNSAGATLDIYEGKNVAGKTFPIRAFTVRNVEVPMTMFNGAKEYIFYCLYSGTFNTNQAGYVNYIGDSTSFAFQPLSEAAVTKAYVNGKQMFTLNGDVNLNPLNMKIQNIITTDVKSSSTSGFPLPSGYDITVASGTLTIYDNVIATEGSAVTIAKGAALDTNGKNIYVLDADDDNGPGVAESCPGHGSTAPWVSYDVHGNFNVIVNEDAVIDVNGTLIASGGFFTSSGNAAIISSEGTGVVEVSKVTADGTVAVKYDYGGVQNLAVTSAKLKNADNTYVETSDGVNLTYTYKDGKWASNAVAQVAGGKKYATLEAALGALADGSGYITMLKNTHEQEPESGVTISGTVTIDLNGYDIDVPVNVSGTLNGIDSKTNDLGISGVYGTISSLSGNGTVTSIYSGADGEVHNGKTYVKIAGTNGTSFHRIRFGIDHYTYYINGDVGAITFNAAFLGDSEAMSVMSKLGMNVNGDKSTYMTNIFAENGLSRGVAEYSPAEKGATYTPSGYALELTFTQLATTDVFNVSALMEIAGMTELMDSIDYSGHNVFNASILDEGTNVQPEEGTQ